MSCFAQTRRGPSWPWLRQLSMHSMNTQSVLPARCVLCPEPQAVAVSGTACAQPVLTEGCPGSRAAAPGLQALHGLLVRGTSLPVCCLLPCCDRHVRTQWPAQSIVLAAAQPRWCLRLKSTGMMRQAGVLRLSPEHYPIPQVPLAQAHPNPAVFVQCGSGVCAWFCSHAFVWQIFE